MNRLGLLTCVTMIGFHGIAHANQVDGTAPPPPPAPAVTPAPSEQAPPATVPATVSPPPPPPAPTASTAPPANYAPAPPPAQVGVGGSAQWQTPSPGAGFVPSTVGVEEHDGFFLRLALGFGGAFWNEAGTPGSGFTGDLEISGPSSGVDISIGAVVTDNLALHLSLFGMSVLEPDVTVDGEVLGTAKNSALAGSGIGVGVTYYLMPANVYISGALGIGAARFTFNTGTSDETAAQTDNGYALNLMVGKEWWVSDQWGLGIAAQLVHVNVPDADTRLVGTGFQLMFSATCN